MTDVRERLQVVAPADEHGHDNGRAREHQDHARNPFRGSPMDPLAEPLEPEPLAPGFPFAHPGKGVLISGPTGRGRSSLAQACAYDAAKHGQRVAYLGYEVTRSEFNTRAADLADRRDDDPHDADLREQLARVEYFDLPTTLKHADQHPDDWTREMSQWFQVVLIDPLSAAATSLGLDFMSDADFLPFYHRLVQPLVTRGALVAMLDNIGHSEDARKRSKGASGKEDCVDLSFSCSPASNPAGLLITAIKVRPECAAFRLGAKWVFDRDTRTVTREAERDQGSFRPTGYMERLSNAVEANPGLSITALRTAAGVKSANAKLPLELLENEGYIETRENANGTRVYHSLKPYRASAEPDPDTARAERFERDYPNFSGASE